MQQRGNVPLGEMDRTFNMGLGMVVVCESARAAELVGYLEGQGERPYRIGEIVPGESGVTYV